MKKTFVTTMPDRAGAFLKASRIIADLDLNITRVSYNKAIDTHTLFIEVEGSHSPSGAGSEVPGGDRLSPGQSGRRNCAAGGVPIAGHARQCHRRTGTH